VGPIAGAIAALGNHHRTALTLRAAGYSAREAALLAALKRTFATP
jgi:hypothetical protein